MVLGVVVVLVVVMVVFVIIGGIRVNKLVEVVLKVIKVLPLVVEVLLVVVQILSPSSFLALTNTQSYSDRVPNALTCLLI